MNAQSEPNLRNMALSRAALALLLAIGLALSIGQAAVADNSVCCPSAPDSLIVDPSSYKLWPSGSRTFVSVVWNGAESHATFEVRNMGSESTPPTNAALRIDNHDPATEALLNSVPLTLPIPGLQAGDTVTLSVPLDYTQCDIYVTVDLSSGEPVVMRTGNPATC